MNQEHNITVFWGFLSSSSLVSRMAIFNDNAYLVLALLGALASVISVATSVIGDERETASTTIMKLIKGLIVGAILTPLMLLIYINVGDDIITSILHVDIDGKTDVSVWWLISLIGAWNAVAIWEYFGKLIRKKAKRKLNEQ